MGHRLPEGERRLAAIMFTDMVGFTSLAQQNETLAMELLEEQRKLVRPHLVKYKGKEVKTIGDAFLVVFPNALDATKCAYDIQRAIRELNLAVPENRRIHLRIGVHLGDVVESGGDISGDAVNVASRIEPLADDGGVCVTRQVYDQVQNKFELPLTSLGPRLLRNVSIPVEIYRMIMPWTERQIPSIAPTMRMQGEESSWSSSGIPQLDELLAGGYPQKSAILVVGPPGIGKEAIGYWFTQVGLVQGDFCLYVSRLSVGEVLEDVRGFGIDMRQKVPFWLASYGGQLRLDVNDLDMFLSSVREILRQNATRRIRIVADILSTLLMLNQPETVYKFLTQLLEEIKRYDAVLVATLEEGMHKPEVIAAMQQLFDGVVEMRLYEEGLRVVPLLRVRKMRGVPPQPGYFNFSLTRTGMELSGYVR